ncbi:universal stress protein [Georgenia sp. H159]|uniref:universal stress protein n=1 Tax=Georgenia sp. H159 TaxID=3076115 RepID=UPI002D76DF22|nr:universal stress protein [Georgenia sp. H159]
MRSQTYGPTGAIVVGVDGSPLSDAALRWAAAEAERTQLPLHVVHVFVHVAVIGGYVSFTADPEELAGHVRDEAVRTARSERPDLEVTAEIRVGAAAPELIAASEGAAMLVLGARGHGRVAGLVIGSVSQQVAMHAGCPVVVVRGVGVDPAAPVVVGMDGSAESVGALRFAVGHARALGAPVRVVRSEYVESPPGVPPGAWYGELVEQTRQVTADVRSMVEERYPGVELRVVREHPVAALVEESADASMLVVATRGLGGFAGLLLGSVSQGVLTRATVPVAVVPRSEAEEAPADPAG